MLRYIIVCPCRESCYEECVSVERAVMKSVPVERAVMKSVSL